MIHCHPAFHCMLLHQRVSKWSDLRKESTACIGGLWDLLLISFLSVQIWLCFSQVLPSSGLLTKHLRILVQWNPPSLPSQHKVQRHFHHILIIFLYGKRLPGLSLKISACCVLGHATSRGKEWRFKTLQANRFARQKTFDPSHQTSKKTPRSALAVALQKIHAAKMPRSNTDQQIRSVASCSSVAPQNGTSKQQKQKNAAVSYDKLAKRMVYSSLCIV